MSGFSADPAVDLDEVAARLLRINIFHCRVLSRLYLIAKQEIRDNEGKSAILFRGNTLFTKSMEMYLRTIGGDFLEAALGDVVKRICKENIILEIDPNRFPNSGSGFLRDRECQEPGVLDGGLLDRHLQRSPILSWVSLQILYVPT